MKTICKFRIFLLTILWKLSITISRYYKDKAEKDMSGAEEKFHVTQKTYEQARDDCSAYIFRTAAEQINAQGIYLETLYCLDIPYLPVIFATKDEFAALTFDGMQKWSFALAEGNADGYFAGGFVDK